MGGALVLQVVELLCGHQRFGNADQAERRAALGDEIDLVPVWAQELWDLPWRPGLCFLCEDLDSLTALGRLAFEHVAVVRLRGCGVFGKG